MKTKGLACLTIGIALVAGAGVALASAPSTKLPSQTSEALKLAVSDWIGKQAEASKNEYGKPTKRGHFSRDFSPSADGSYQVTAHVETAGEETKTTERFLLTLKPSAKGFEVAGQELQDTYAGLHRETSGTCSSFEKFTFHREGISLDSGSGSVCITFYLGRPSRFAVMGSGMRYSFEPPASAQALHLNPDFHAIYPVVKKDHEREVSFPPAAFLFSCDPETCERLLAEQFTGMSYELPVAGAPSILSAGPVWARPLFENWEQDLRENPFAHFRSPYEAGNRSWEVFVAREIAPFIYPGAQEFQDLADASGDLPGSGVSLSSDNWGGWENEFAVWPRRLDIRDQLFSTVYGYYSEDTLKTTTPYDLERREDKEARWHHVYKVKGNVDMGIEDPEMLSAQIEFGIELKQPVRELPFFIQSIPRREFTGQDKARELYVNSVQLEGKDITWTRTSQLGGIVVLPKEMPAGSKLNLRMDFKTKALYKINPSFTYVSRFGWMPFVRFGDFIDEFELTIRSPAEYKVLGIGQKVAQRQEGNLMVTTWRADSPVVFPSITFGRYQEDTAGKDFKPALKIDGTAIPVTVHVDKSSFTDWGINPSSLRPLAQQAVNSINLYREVSGVDYPYGELNFVNDPQGFLYGQAPSSLIYLGSGVFRGEGFLASLPNIRDATAISKFLRSVVAHEVGHQWWGSRVSNANGRNYWFVESLAEYFSALFLEFVEGERQYEEQVEEWRRTTLDRRLKSSVQNASVIWSGEESDGSPYQAAVYNKGPYAFHMLREIFKGQGPDGPDGADKKFFEFLKAFSQELTKKREIVTLDIQQAAETGLGGIDPEGKPYKVDLDWFFDQWIRSAGVPQYRLLYDVRQTEDGGWLIEGSVEQRVLVGSSRERNVLDATYYRGIVDVTVLAKGQEYSSRLVLNGSTTPFKLKVKDKPVEVALNKHNEILAHDVLVNRSWD